MKPLLDLAAC